MNQNDAHQSCLIYVSIKSMPHNTKLCHPRGTFCSLDYHSLNSHIVIINWVDKCTRRFYAHNSQDLSESSKVFSQSPTQTIIPTITFFSMALHVKKGTFLECCYFFICMINGMKEPPTFFSSPLNANQQSIEPAKPKAVRIVIFQRNRKIKITYSHGSSPTRRRSSSLSVNTSCHPSFWSNWPSNLNMEANPHLNSA